MAQLTCKKCGAVHEVDFRIDHCFFCRNRFPVNEQMKGVPAGTQKIIKL